MGRQIEYNKGDVLGTGLVFLGEVEPKISKGGKKRRRAKFECKCGTEFVTSINEVRKKGVKSCGCLKREVVIARNKANSTHGLNETKAYITYQHMIKRCYDATRKDYSYYGGRGIKVCDRWLEPDGKGMSNFYEDMGERTGSLTLDREDVNGDYSPSNCRWASKREQSINTRKRSTNSTGKTGVTRSGDGYTARINVDGMRKYLIHTKDLELAIFCREEAEIHYYGKHLN